jgi:hypothetical protein
MPTLESLVAVGGETDVFSVSIDGDSHPRTTVTRRFVFLFLDEIGVLSLLQYSVDLSSLTLTLTPNSPSAPSISLIAETESTAKRWAGDIKRMTIDFFFDYLTRVPIPESRVGLGQGGLGVSGFVKSVSRTDQEMVARGFLRSKIKEAHEREPTELPSEKAERLREQLERELENAKGRDIPEAEEEPVLDRMAPEMNKTMLPETKRRPKAQRTVVTEDQIIQEILKCLE